MDDWLEAEQRVERAQQLFESCQWTEALKELEAAIAIDPSHAAWHANRGTILDQLHRYTEAIDSYRQALELEPNDRDVRSQLGIDLARTGRFEEALANFEELAKTAPDYEPAYCHRIAILARLGRHEEAEEMFYLAQQITEECPHAFVHMGESLYERGEYTRAIYCWSRALRLDPRYANAKRRIGDAYRKRGDRESARQYYLAQYREDPGNTSLLCDLGDLLVEMNDLDAAAMKFTQVIELNPQDARAHVALGRIAARRGRFADAVKALEAAAAIDNEHPGVCRDLGTALFHEKRFPEARRYLEDAVLQAPDDADALLALGNCLLALGRPEDAEEHFHNLNDLCPDNPAVHHNLGVCSFRQNRLLEGIAHCEAALRIDPHYVLSLRKLSRAYLQVGRWNDARRTIRLALQLDPGQKSLRRLRRLLVLYRLRRLGERFAAAIRRFVRATPRVLRA